MIGRRRSVCALAAAGIAAVAWAAADRPLDHTIVPGVRVGPIDRNTSESDLARLYGANHVVPTDVEVGEGETVPGTIIFPDDPARRLEILWSDALNRRSPQTIYVRNAGSKWATDSGITVGTSLTTLERLNGRPFHLAGFAWDYGGTVLDADGGRLSALGGEGSSRTLLLRLDPVGQQDTPAYGAVMGDKSFRSDNPAMRALNPTVYEMAAEFPAPPVTRSPAPTPPPPDCACGAAAGCIYQEDHRAAAGRVDGVDLIAKNCTGQPADVTATVTSLDNVDATRATPFEVVGHVAPNGRVSIFAGSVRNPNHFGVTYRSHWKTDGGK